MPTHSCAAAPRDALLAVNVLALVQQLEPLVVEGEEAHVGPTLVQLLGPVAQRLAAASGIDGDRRERIAQLLGAQPLAELDRAEIVLVQPARQLLEERVVRIRADALDDELPACDADGERIAIDEEQGNFPQYPVHRVVEQRVTHRIDGVLLHRDRELHEEIRELAGQRRLVPGRDQAAIAVPVIGLGLERNTAPWRRGGLRRGARRARRCLPQLRER
jgi:hypothetical protein